jgi:SAM-dependent methyltransferase
MAGSAFEAGNWRTTIQRTLPTGFADFLPKDAETGGLGLKYFVIRFIAPLARKRGWRSFCEIGASSGESTDELLKLPLDAYKIIDPCFDQDLPAKYRADRRVTVFRMNSLEALTPPELLRAAAPFDCILIDGDHNWYTVFNELRLIHEHGLLRPGGIIFLHDVSRPWGRRDMYYQPDTIPAEFRQPHAPHALTDSQRQPGEAQEKNAGTEEAAVEGGPRNGVLTAIEDFLAEQPEAYRFFRIDYQYGFGVIERRTPGVGSTLIFSSLRIKGWVYAKSRRMANPVRRTLRKLRGR